MSSFSFDRAFARIWFAALFSMPMPRPFSRAPSWAQATVCNSLDLTGLHAGDLHANDFLFV